MRTPIVTAISLGLSLALLALGQLVRPLPEPSVRLTLAARHTFAGAPPALTWPSRGQAAIDVEGLGTMGGSGAATPTPTASVAKVMTAYVFLRYHPLAAGEPGPSYTISPEEAARLPQRKARGESLVTVKPGQRFTERQALEALLIVSANNVAHEMARWDAGGDAQFVQKMNAAARELGMRSTTYTDPSGYDRGTVSTAADQVKLLRAAMRVPAFAEIVAKRTYESGNGAEGARAASNILLGRYGVIGGKTGYTDAAGGNYVFAARKNVSGVDTTLVGAVMAQEPGNGATPALDAAAKLLQSAEKSMTAVTLAAPGGQVATLDNGVGTRTPMVATTPITAVGWPGLTVRLSLAGRPAAAKVNVGPASTAIRAEHDPAGPSVTGRLTRVP